MIPRDARRLWESLHSVGIVKEPKAPSAPAANPWMVRVGMGITGWIGAGFLLGFLSLTLSKLLNQSSALLFFALLTCAAGAYLFRTRGSEALATQFAMALSVAGQGFFLSGLQKLFENVTVIAIAFVILQTALIFALPNFTHRVWAAWSGTIALAIVFVDWKLTAIAPPLIAFAFAWAWLNEFRFPSQIQLHRAASYGLVLAWSAADLYAQFANRPGEWDGLRWIAGVIGAFVVLWTVLQLLKREKIQTDSPTGRGILSVTSALAIASIFAPSLAPALLVLVLGFATANRILLGLGVLFALKSLVYFYYSLEVPLLQKSLLLLGTGGVLLLARRALPQGKRSPEEAAPTREDKPYA